MEVTDFTLTRFQFARDRVIGDSQVRVAHAHIGVLELHTRDGTTGTGFFSSLFQPLPALRELQRVFRAEAWPHLVDMHPAAFLNRISRPRGGNIGSWSLPFEPAVDQALWDLQGKALGLPLWRLLGGTDRRVRLYASGLGFHLSDAEFAQFFTAAKAQGYGAFKIKVGHRDVAWDLHRLAALRDALGSGQTVMVDANEAWSPKEAIRRLNLYARAGHDALWVEDPCLRDDFEGLREVRLGLPEVMVNTGEYLDLRGKRRLIEARAVDILNVHGVISDVVKAGWLAAEHGLEVSLGNTSFEIGVHLAAALPECRRMEYSFQNYGHLLEQPVEIQDGSALAPRSAGPRTRPVRSGAAAVRRAGDRPDRSLAAGPRRADPAGDRLRQQRTRAAPMTMQLDRRQLLAAASMLPRRRNCRGGPGPPPASITGITSRARPSSRAWSV